MRDIKEKLAELGFELPSPSPPAANYSPFRRAGQLVFISGQLPISDGKLQFTGKVGGELTLEEGQRAAELCALNILAQLSAACDGDWSKVDHCVELGGFVQSAPDFFRQHEVLNGASNLIAAAMGEDGIHSRFAVGVSALPLDAAVEVKAIFKLK